MFDIRCNGCGFALFYFIQLKTIPVEINPSTMTSATPITLSKDQLTCYTSKNDQNDRSCMLLIEVSYAECPNGNSNDTGMFNCISLDLIHSR